MIGTFQRKFAIVDKDCLLFLMHSHNGFQDGVITTWSTSLELLKGTVMDDKATEIDRAQLARLKRSNLWVTDMAVMSQCNVLVVSTTSREFDFYDISTTVYKCQYRLCGEYI